MSPKFVCCRDAGGLFFLSCRCFGAGTGCFAAIGDADLPAEARGDSADGNAGSAVFDASSARFDIGSALFDASSARIDASSALFDIGSARFDASSALFDIGSARFDASSARFDIGASGNGDPERATTGHTACEATGCCRRTGSGDDAGSARADGIRADGFRAAAGWDGG